MFEIKDERARRTELLTVCFTHGERAAIRKEERRRNLTASDVLRLAVRTMLDKEPEDD